MPPNGKTSPTNSSTLSVDTAIQLVPYGDDPLRHLASLLLERHRDRLPDLSQSVVLFPHSSAVPRFRRMLQQQAALQGHSALLPPATTTLATWACRFAAKDKRCLSEIGREILLLDLLNDFPEWRNRYGVWPLIDSLLTLFDELTMHQCRLPGDPAGFIRQITRSSGMDIDELSPFGSEARLVHALWRAWHERLEKNNLQDRTHQILDGLARSLEALSADTQIYITGFSDFTRAEIEWLKTLRAKHRLVLLLQGRYENRNDDRENPVADLLREMHANPLAAAPQDVYTTFLNRAFAPNEGTLLKRAHEQKAESPSSPVQGRLVIHEAGDSESEARAIDLQVRRWRLQGLHDIGIVTNDRKLARRVRALLERANVELQDAGGWALSTTSAATALARWLECIEQHFAHKPLLDLLKSPFVYLGFGRNDLDRLVPAFEQMVVRARNVASGLENYRFSLDRAADDLQMLIGPEIPAGLKQMLNRLENAATLLTDLIHARPRPALDFLEALQKSLENLGLSTSFENDAAGRELLAMLDDMKTAAAHGGMRLTWAEFHPWLKRHMEQRRFHPPMKGSGIELMGFAESRLYRCDALIIAGAVREHMPGKISVPPYFNDNVRAELGLPTLARRYAQLFHDFRRLLEAAPRVLISLRREQEGERLMPSPWVERLRAFHETAYHAPLNDPELEWLVQQPEAVIANREAPLAIPAVQPAARLPASLQPSPVTATDHQRLLDCPYQYYCSNGLGLRPEKDVREDIEKMDFGTHVHRILQAFHAGAPKLPGPWQKPLNDDTLPEAEALLRNISQQVFANDLRRHFFTRGWLYRWEACIPAYLAWEMQHSSRWRIQAMEWKKQRDYQEDNTHVAIAGRVDRLDRDADGYCIIDYKTGTVSSRDLLLRGEEIQLPFYALLLDEENVAQALYLSIQDGKVTEKSALDAATLAMLRAAVRKRLLLLKQQLDEETPLPAWGDAETCRLCDMEGLCRREMWTEKFRSAS